MSVNTCAICEEKFHEWSAYASHKLNANCHKKILPMRTSGRTHNQIVADVEQKWAEKGWIVE